MTKTVTDPRKWYAIRGVAGQEAKAIKFVEELAGGEAWDVEAYMPVVTRWRRIRFSRKATKREKFERPLFPGVFFFLALPTHCTRLTEVVKERKMQGVKFYTRCDEHLDNVPAIMPKADIERIRWMHISGEFDETRPKEPDYTPEVGDRAFVENGDVVSRVGEILKIQAKHGTATLLIGKMKVKAQLKTLRPEPKEEVAA